MESCRWQRERDREKREKRECVWEDRERERERQKSGFPNGGFHCGGFHLGGFLVFLWTFLVKSWPSLPSSPVSSSAATSAIPPRQPALFLHLSRAVPPTRVPRHRGRIADATWLSDVSSRLSTSARPPLSRGSSAFCFLLFRGAAFLVSLLFFSFSFSFSFCFSLTPRFLLVLLLLFAFCFLLFISGVETQVLCALQLLRNLVVGTLIWKPILTFLLRMPTPHTLTHTFKSIYTHDNW